MIVILTSNYDGGILQLAGQMEKSFAELDYEATVFVPSEVKETKNEWRKYERRISLLPINPTYKRIAKEICSLNPEFVFVCDTNLVTSRIILSLPHNIRVITCVHDVYSHPTHSELKTRIKGLLSSFYLNNALMRANKVILFSKNSKNLFVKKYPEMKEKAELLHLGAHVPDAIEEKPKEMEGITHYILFFGRMDRYKGISRLLNAYNRVQNEMGVTLVLAGRGTLTDEESRLSKARGVKLIKRYISDGEMKWLFANTEYTVLPYIEASQSGVLAMSYYFGKPVIVSNLEGLTEFVLPGVTGFAFNNQVELERLLIKAIRDPLKKENVMQYYRDNMEWVRNLKKCLSNLLV